MIKIGVIGGTGLDNPDILKDSREIKIEKTPYGKPSSPLKVGKIDGVDVVLLSRHGKDHTIPPSEVNYIANIYTLKQQGVTHIVATTACGSLKEYIRRGDFVILNQYIDFTSKRRNSIYKVFEPNNPVHTPMSDPFDYDLRKNLIESAKELNIKHHSRGTVITIEGPRFSTKAESHMYRIWGTDVINMTTATEAAVANELGVPYAVVAMSTDYDCWKEDEKPVCMEEIMKVMDKNSKNMIKLLKKTIPKINVSMSERIKSVIENVPDWPKKGIMFKDITTLLQDSHGFKDTIEILKKRYEYKKIDKVIGIESRGFIFGAPLAYLLGVGFVPIRKSGKLPPEIESEEYTLEYGKDKIEIKKGSIKKNERVVIVDDLLATGGTITAAKNLVKKLGGEIVECAFVMELSGLNGRKKIDEDVYSIIKFDS